MVNNLGEFPLIKQDRAISLSAQYAILHTTSVNAQ